MIRRIPTPLQQQAYDALMEKSVDANEAERLALEYHAKNCVQMSSKYRTLAKLPDGETGVQALQRLAPEELQNLEDRAKSWIESQARDHYLQQYAAIEGNEFHLDLRTFKAYKTIERAQKL
jgi:hypothetical protein